MIALISSQNDILVHCYTIVMKLIILRLNLVVFTYVGKNTCI
jgi:hypothetical protein